MSKEAEATSWLDKLLAEYPEQQDDEEGVCLICAEEDGLCRTAAEELVDEVAHNCQAETEDVARWIIEQNIAIWGISPLSVTDEYDEFLKSQKENAHV